MTLVVGDFTPGFRGHVVTLIKKFGVERVRASMIADGYAVSFTFAITRSIMRKEGW